MHSDLHFAELAYKLSQSIQQRKIFQGIIEKGTLRKNNMDNSQIIYPSQWKTLRPIRIAT